MSDIVEARPGQEISNFAAELMSMASKKNQEVKGKHNGLILTATPKSTLLAVLRPYNERQKRSYEASATVIWVREIDPETDNACWVVCAKDDPDARRAVIV